MRVFKAAIIGLVFGLSVQTAFAVDAQIANDKLKLGIPGNTSADKILEFNKNAGASNPKLKLDGAAGKVKVCHNGTTCKVINLGSDIDSTGASNGDVLTADGSGNSSFQATSAGSHPANTVLAGPTSGGSATATYRALVEADLPAQAVVTKLPSTTRDEAALISGGTCARNDATGTYSTANNQWISAVSHVSTGICTLTLANFSGFPVCTVSLYNTNGAIETSSVSSTTVTVTTRDSSFVVADKDFVIACHGIK